MTKIYIAPLQWNYSEPLQTKHFNPTSL